MRTCIVIPTYNREKLLYRAILSVLAQKRPADEIYVINDGTPIHFLPEFLAKIRLFQTTGSVGPTIARKIALNNTDCDVICYLDDDDELFPNHLDRLLPEIEKGHQFAFSKALYRYPDSETTDPEPSNRGVKRYYDPNALLDQNIAPISSFIHTRKAYDKIGGWDTSLIRMEDWDFWGRMFIQFGPPSFVNEVTNVIYKGLDNNRTDSNQFVYAMGCHWRDVVADRLKYLSQQKRGYLLQEDLKHIPIIPKVAVVMPVYNAEKYLVQAMESVLNQTYKDFEIIAVNDASTDKSLEILSSFANKDKRVRIFSNKENLGVTKTLNYGVLMSRSEYVARMDADDIAHPDRFALQVDFLDKKKDIFVVGSCFNSVSEDLSRIIWRNDVEKDPEEIAKVLLQRCCVGHPTVMMRRRVFEVLGGYSEKPEHHTIEDYEFWLRVSKKFKIANLPQFLLTHRVHDQQVSSRISDIQKKNTERLKTECEK